MTTRHTYTEQNNIYTCENGHGYSYHTIEANMLREEGVCQLCLKEEPTTEETQAKWKELEDAGYIPKNLSAVQFEVQPVQREQMQYPARLLILDGTSGPHVTLEMNNMDDLHAIGSELYKEVYIVTSKPLPLGAESDGAEDPVEEIADGYRKLLKDSNEAYELLWNFCDIIHDKPRHGNVLARANEALIKLREEKENDESR